MSRSWHFIYDICGQPRYKTASFYLLPQVRKVETRGFFFLILCSFCFVFHSIFLKFDEALKQKKKDGHMITLKIGS